MSDITNGSGNNFGGLKSLTVYIQDDLTSVSPLTLADGKSAVEIIFVRHEALMDNPEVPGEQGNIFQNTINFNISKLSQVLQQNILQLQGKKLVAKVTDNNNVTWLCGNLDEYGVMQRKATTGSSPDQRNEYQVALNFYLSQEAPVYTF